MIVIVVAVIVTILAVIVTILAPIVTIDFLVALVASHVGVILVIIEATTTLVASAKLTRLDARRSS